MEAIQEEDKNMSEEEIRARENKSLEIDIEKGWKIPINQKYMRNMMIKTERLR